MIPLNECEVVETRTTTLAQMRLLKEHHYKGISDGGKGLKLRHRFSLIHKGRTIGVVLYGEPFSRKSEELRGPHLELKRLVMHPDAPKNAGSYVIARSLKALRTKGVKKVVTFADPEQGHTGAVYKASNFTFVGKEKYRQQWLQVGSRKVSMRNVYQKNRLGEYGAAALEYQAMKSRGEAQVVYSPRKLIFEKNL